MGVILRLIATPANCLKVRSANPIRQVWYQALAVGCLSLVSEAANHKNHSAPRCTGSSVHDVSTHFNGVGGGT
jgi:hypothetical protein